MPNPKTKQIDRNIAMEIIKDIRNLFKKKKKDKSIKDKIIRDIRTLFETEGKDYYEPVRISNALDDNFIEYESNAGKDERLSIEEYLDKIIPYISYTVNDLKTQDEWKIQLAIKINFSSSKDSKKTRNIHTNNDNIEIMVGNDTNEIIENLLILFYKKIKKA